MTLASQNSSNGFSGVDYLTEDSVLRSHPLYSRKKHRCCHSDGDGFTIISSCFFVLTITITVALIIQIHYGSPEVTPHGAVATDEEECSRVGVTIMRDGGSAVDVAIASILCMAVVHPHTVGPGGSGVMLVHDHKSNTSTVLDFMSGVPRSHHPDELQPHEIGGQSIGVPGLLRGLEYAHSKYGKLPWQTLFQPSIRIARRGFNVSAQLENALKKSNISKVDGVTPFEKTFFPKGIMLQKGTFMQRENFAEFLDIVAKHGADSFYAVDFGKEEFKALRAEGAEVHVKDFLDYKVRERPCIHISVKNMSIFTASAPFGGPQLLTALQLLQNSKITHATTPSILYHSFAEAIQRSYAGFIKLAYSDEQSLQNLTEMLLRSTKDEAIDSSVTQANVNVPLLPEQSASSVSVIDTYDQYVTAIVGLGTYFGSRVMTKHGILFNNHLANLLSHDLQDETHQSRARPITTYTPVIITDTRQVCGLRIVLASPEVGAAVQVVGQMVFKDNNLKQAIEQPRITVKPGTSQVFVEDLRNADRLPGKVRNSLSAMNHSLQILHLPYASVNGISKVKDMLISWSDARGGGVAHRLEPTPRHLGNVTSTS